ncbi:MAG: SEC-C metal-binding domain-containing protein [bacterium]
MGGHKHGPGCDHDHDDGKEHTHDHGKEHTHDHGPPAEPVRRAEPKVGRNEPCPCGSGKKFKKCCGVSA